MPPGFKFAEARLCPRAPPFFPNMAAHISYLMGGTHPTGGCVVPADAILHTREGLARASAADGREVWTSRGWSRATVVFAGEMPAVKVTFSDGSWTVCACTASWPLQLTSRKNSPTNKDPQETKENSLGSAISQSPQILGQSSQESPESLYRIMDPAAVSPVNSPAAIPESLVRIATAGGRLRQAPLIWEARAAADLRCGDRIIQSPQYSVTGLPAIVMNAEHYSLGRSFGSNPVSKKLLLNGVEELSGDALRAFIDGWSDAQNGCLVGSATVIAELQILMRRLGVRRTLLDNSFGGGTAGSLVVDSASAWPLPEGSAPRHWLKNLQRHSQIVISVMALPRRKMYHVTCGAATASRMTAGTHMIAVGNTYMSDCPTIAPI